MWFAAGAAVVCCALLMGASPAGAASSSRVILKPKPGQKVTWHPLRLVVRAGPETDDLGARLNGVAIGREFQRKGRHRVLVVSRSHGLRHGLNKLTVVARTGNGTRERRATVRFKVAHKRPLTGADRYRRIVAGVRTELVGRVKEHPSGPSGDRVSWKLVDVPRGSRRRTTSRSRRERQRVGRQSSGSPNLSGLRQANSLTPTFKPDVHGTYTFAMTAGRGSRATTDQVELDAVPNDPLVEVNAGIFKDGVPGIKVDDKHYPAPKLFGEDYPFKTNGYSDDGRFKQALFQVLVLDRSTTEVVSNRTYGVCAAGPAGPANTCRLGPAPFDATPGAPGPAPMAVEILAETDEGLIIVNSLPASLHGTGGANFSKRYVSSLGLPELAQAIGFPDEKNTEFAARLGAASLDGLSGIGVPGMEPGEANVALVPGRLDGYLVPDKNSPRNYSYINKTRVPFDTRAAVPGCNVNVGCVTQTVGDQTHTHTEADGGGGFLVSVNDRDTLALQASEYFRTIGGQDPSGGVLGMTAFLKAWHDAGSLVTITSVHTPGLNRQFLVDVRTGSDPWHRLATEVASLGGTLHRFNTAAVTPGEDYTLVGFGGAGEGNGIEEVGPNSRIRGMLVPDKESRFGPANPSSSADEPAEVLVELMLQPPNEEWTMQLPGEGSGQLSSKPWWPEATADDSPGTRAAIPFIGGQVSQLTEDPRSAYWINPDFVAGDKVRDGIKGAKLVDPDTKETCACTQPELDKAIAQLLLELDYVANVRTYVGDLAYPSGVAGMNAWGETKSAAGVLTKDRDYLNEKAEAEIEAIEGAFGIVASLIDLGEVGAAIKGLSKTKKFLKASAAILELAAESTALAWDGSKSGEDPDEARVIADEVGMQLQKQAQDVSKSFRSLGDVIVSDWGKLSVIGQHGGCIPPPAKKGCPAGLEQLALTDEMKDAATTAADLAQRRTAYQHLLPYSFPIWDTGLTFSCSFPPCSPDTGPEPTSRFPTFSCVSDFGSSPFSDVPKEGFFVALDTLSPGSYYRPEAGGFNQWRTYLSVGRSSLTYGWASEEIYKTMFDPVGSKQEDPKIIPLGISPLDYMIEANERRAYLPGAHDSCSWGTR